MLNNKKKYHKSILTQNIEILTKDCSFLIGDKIVSNKRDR
jgi:hypothetical protein